MTSTAKTSAGSRGTRPRTTKASTAGATRSSSTASPGSTTWATTTITRALPTRKPELVAARSGPPAGRGRRATVAAAPRGECTTAVAASSAHGRTGDSTLRWRRRRSRGRGRRRSGPGSNVTKRTGAGIRSAAARWIALGEADRLLAGEAGGAVEAALVDGDDVEVVPRQAHGVLEVEAQHGLVGQPVDRRQRLGERQRRGAPHRVAVERGEHDRPLGAVDGEGEQGAGVEGDGHRAARRGRGRSRTPDHTGTGAGGRHGRRAGGAGSRRRGAWSSSGPSWATGRPLDGDDDALAARRPGARRRRGRHAGPGRTVWTHVYTSTIAIADASPAYSAAMNFAFTDEQEELRKTVRAFLDNKSPESAVRELMETEDGYDEAVWKQAAEQLGLQGLSIPEEFGGSGYGFIELGIVLEEMGRALFTRPVLLDRRARRHHAAAHRRRRRQEGLPAGHRQRRDDRHARLHRAVGQVGRSGHHDGGHRRRRLVEAQRHEELRARRPPGQPGHRRRPHAARASACSPSTATPPGSPARRCRRWTRPASRPSSSSPTRRPA